jgi:predicted DNA-binding protein (MmcQ/YjbR family)
MTPQELRSWCLGLPGAEETFPFSRGTSVFKVGGKIFAISALESTPLGVSVKCDPELAESLRTSYASVAPGYHLNKRHWITITLGGDLPDQQVRDLIEDSHDLVRPKRAPTW